MPKYHVDSIQHWDSFDHAGKTYDLGHLDCHEVNFQSQQGVITYVVTYGLHCFTKDNTGFNIPVEYADGRHTQPVCLERYEASKSLRGIIQGLDAAGAYIYQTDADRFFTIHMLNSATGMVEPYKVCMAFFREHRLLRIHVTSAYFVRTGEGAPGKPIGKHGFSIFKITKDTQRKRKGDYPKEVRNRHKKN